VELCGTQDFTKYENERMGSRNANKRLSINQRKVQNSFAYEEKYYKKVGLCQKHYLSENIQNPFVIEGIIELR
jgi:hypothetical protein